jgi:hypothetical protein
VADGESDTVGVEELHRSLLARWNAHDATGFAALFEPEGHSVG